MLKQPPVSTVQIKLLRARVYHAQWECKQMCVEACNSLFRSDARDGADV